jgi:hypothetical protein
MLDADRTAEPRQTCSLYPWLRHIFADAGNAGSKLRDAPGRDAPVERRDHQASPLTGSP